MPAWVEPLRTCGHYSALSERLPWRRTVVLVFVCGGLAGLMMGSFAGRIEQCLLSAAKVPLLLLLSAATCLPAFLAIHAMLGLRHDMQALLRTVLATMAAFAVTLASVGPVLLLIYLSLRDYSVARLASGMAFAVACLPAQAVFAQHFRPLLQKQQQHGLALKTWLLLYCFVTFQLAWLLRPFVGSPDLPVRLFREDAFGNAYVEVGGILRAWLVGS
tara:strand:- start:46792 stop:47442 length:651 start_codon:yes stop_codon:yes gene_type:complete